MGKIVLGLCILVTVSLAALVDTPDNIYMRNRLIVELTPAAQNLEIKSSNGVISTGYGAFDALLTKYGAKSMIREFPAAKPAGADRQKGHAAGHMDRAQALLAAA